MHTTEITENKTENRRPTNHLEIAKVRLAEKKHHSTNIGQNPNTSGTSLLIHLQHRPEAEVGERQLQATRVAVQHEPRCSAGDNDFESPCLAAARTAATRCPM